MSNISTVVVFEGRYYEIHGKGKDYHLYRLYSWCQFYNGTAQRYSKEELINRSFSSIELATIAAKNDRFWKQPDSNPEAEKEYTKNFNRDLFRCILADGGGSSRDSDGIWNK